MVSGTGVIIGEDLIEGHSCTMCVVLLVTVGVGVLGTVQVNREPEVARQPRGITLRSMRTEIINHAKERTESLSWYSGDQLGQLMGILKERYCQDTLVQLLRRIAIMIENRIRCSGDDRVRSEFFDLVTGCDCSLYEAKVAHELEYQVVKPSCARQRETRGIELSRASTEKLVELGSDKPRLRSSTVVRWR